MQNDQSDQSRVRDPEIRDAVLDLLDGVRIALKRAARDLGGLADEAVDLLSTLEMSAADIWTTVERGVDDIGDDLQDLGDVIAAWPSRIGRLSSSGWTLAQITGRYRLHEWTAGFRSADGAAAALEELHAHTARLYRDAAIHLGGAFLKVGQMLSARSDLLPGQWISELSALQDAVPAASFEAVRPTLEADLGGSVAELFASFAEVPVAAASIGQVHRATTHEGVDVAVKIQRPGIDRLVELDLSLFEISLDAVSSMLPPTDTRTIAAEVRRMLLEELDYEHEARMMSRIAAFFEEHPAIRVPHPLPELVGRRAFASTFVEGRKITDVLDECLERRAAGDEEAAARIDRILGLVLECYLRQTLQAGVFQADPHPGNLLVTDTDELVLLDFGCTKELPDETRALYLSLVEAFLAHDRQQLAALFDALGFETASGSPDTLHAFADALLGNFDKLLSGGGFEWPTEERVFEQLAELVSLSQADPVVRLPEEFVMLGRVFGTLGGLFHHYRPRLQLQSLLPVLRGAMFELH